PSRRQGAISKAKPREQQVQAQGQVGVGMNQHLKESMYAEHVMHLVIKTGGFFQTEIECLTLVECEHWDSSSSACNFVEWYAELGEELLNCANPYPMPTDPCFPIPVRPFDWHEDGPLVVFDPRKPPPF
ncbi:MAG: hypothetical protein N2C12_15745, partial [Planctomycetales bacterium]